MTKPLEDALSPSALDLTALPDLPAFGPVLTVEEAARYLRISRNLAFAACRDGSLPSVRVGRRILVPLLRLQAWLNGEEATPAPPRLPTLR